MEKESMLKTALLGVLMLLFPMGYSFPMQVPPVSPRPLCASQFALVNRACALLPYSRGPPDSSPGQSPEPPGPPPPSTLPSTDENPEDDHRHGGHEDDHRHGGHGRHRHRQRRATHHHIKTSIEAECCRWLAQVDDECVCDMLVHLPRFLARPVHEYTVIVPGSCSITFDCASALIP